MYQVIKVGQYGKRKRVATAKTADAARAKADQLRDKLKSGSSVYFLVEQG